MAGVLFFDLARKTGWAHDSRTPGVPVAGMFELPIPDGNDMGPVYSALRSKAIELIRHAKPTTIGFESAINAMAGMAANKHSKFRTSAKTLRQLGGYVATIECLAHDWRIPCFEVGATTLKKYLAGHGHADKRMMIDTCKRLGWDVGDDDNAADACAGWAHLSSVKDPNFAPKATLLFAQQRLAPHG